MLGAETGGEARPLLLLLPVGSDKRRGEATVLLPHIIMLAVALSALALVSAALAVRLVGTPAWQPSGELIQPSLAPISLQWRSAAPPRAVPRQLPPPMTPQRQQQIIRTAVTATSQATTAVFISALPAAVGTVVLCSRARTAALVLVSAGAVAAVVSSPQLEPLLRLRFLAPRPQTSAG